MALYKLAGPINAVDPNGVTLGNGVGVVNPFWVPGYGCVCVSNGFIALLSMDGYVAELNKYLVSSGDLSYGWDSRNGQILMNAGGGLWTREKVMQVPYQTNWPGPVPPTLTAFYMLQDRTIYLNNRTLYSAAPGQPWVAENVMPFAPAWFGQGRQKTEIFLWAVSGSAIKCSFYDTTTKTFSPTLTISDTVAPYSAVYSTDWGVIVTVSGDGDTHPYQINVWALEAAPASVTAPTLVSGSADPCSTATYQVQVLGADSDPCAEILVDWTVSGGGVLVETQSTSDENGFAQVQVYFPSTISGDEVVLTASVTC